jgi:hypothetical protein
MIRARSVFVRAFGVLASIAVVSLCAAKARADILTVSNLPPVTPTSGTSSGSQGFADIGAPSVSGTGVFPGSINTGTSFTIGNLISTGAQNGYFTGLSTQIFGPVTFVPADDTSLSFGNATMGSFASTSITELTNSPGQRSFYVLGMFSAGTFDPSLTPDPAPASLLITFNQTPENTGAISNSSTLAIPPAAVPEPSTLVIAGLGLAGFAAVDVRRRRRRRLATQGLEG